MKLERNNKVSQGEEVRRTGMLTLRQLVEKRPEGEENMALGFIRYDSIRYEFIVQ